MKYNLLLNHAFVKHAGHIHNGIFRFNNFDFSLLRVVFTKLKYSFLIFSMYLRSIMNKQLATCNL